MHDHQNSPVSTQVSPTVSGWKSGDGPATTALVAQDDHVLGQDQYPANAWQPDEVVADHYALHVPDDMAPGRYMLRAGVYTWPDLTRLDVPGPPDDIIELGPVDIGQ